MTITTDLPTLDGMTVHYGIPVAFLGDDAAMAVMLGHIEPRRALAALNRAVRVDLFYRLDTAIGCGVAEMLAGFEHRWAFLMTHCEDHPNIEVDCGRCEEIHEAGWWMNYRKDNTADTPGAFPITFLEM